MAREILTSGIRPTGELHLGNYYGAMKNILELQNKYQAYFFIVDIHSLTTHPKPDSLMRNVLEIAKDYLAAGLDPEQSTFYTQSSIAEEICELHTYLSMVMPLGDLLRCPTFKEKAKKHPDNVNYGLVGYPVLMAADILIHKGKLVPVGEDQLVHLEMARTIVRKFNQLYGEIFPEPRPIIENAVRIPSLSGKGKMSKSDLANSYISMKDSKEIIHEKVRKAYSDPTRVYKHQAGNPSKEGCNVYHLHTYFTDQETLNEIQVNCQGAAIGCIQCKSLLSNSIQTLIEPFRDKREKLTDDYIYDVLALGRRKAKESSQKVIAEVRKAIGLRMF
ncbi:tryptophan--tRNA ligase [Ammoniphilus sp. CFH 90114]|uniref:tryptophan--tRNA ligase n=1 Tax=Ammoniphilus sp. CFH 90114 TaxID=2493665 RepID=UPI00100EF35C|nr:tryptophan--tRNA ligase [Ammoniphilus sp. CFH 90114]RXT03625.1 tryptophan--tRNA ligase [Ammoniphilus sp. CFH 90114]